MTDIGFTGTKRGMSELQQALVRSWLLLLPEGAFHHGDCVGADAEAHRLSLATLRPVVIHPPDQAKERAFCTGAERVLEEKPYLERNNEIATVCDVLIAAPGGNREVHRSGTWATVRYARKHDKPVIVVFPNGGWTAEYRGRAITLASLNAMLRMKVNS